MGSIGNTALDVIGTAAQLEADPAGYFRNRQAQQQHQAVQQAQYQANAPLLNQLQIPAEAFKALPPEQQMHTLGTYQKQQDLNLNTKKEARQGEQFDKTYEIQKRTADNRDAYNKLLQSSQVIQQKNLDLRNKSLTEQLTDKAERKDAIGAASNVYEQAIQGLPGPEQLKAKAALAAAKAKGDFRAVDTLLKPEQVKPGTPQHLFQAARNGEVNLQDPSAIENYFKANMKSKDGARAAANNFKAAYLATPEKQSFYDSWFGTTPPPKLNPAGQAALQGQTPQAPAPQAMPQPVSANEVERVDPKTQKTAVFDANTKQFLRWK
jgi:hypothetical protein